MKTLPAAIVVSGAILAFATGCVERRVTYVPVYPTQASYPAQPVYTYPNQTGYTPPPGTISAPADGGQLVTVDPNAPTTTQPAPQVVQPAPTVVAPAAPPAPQVEVVPVAPGPDYVWMPGYWNWNGTVWIWVGGRWGVRPYPRAVWVGPRWVYHGRGYVWRGGHWR